MRPSISARNRVALVLQGGGARGGYQIGALKAIAEITGGRRSPFAIVCGASVGAINAAPFAAISEDFQTGVRHLEELWRGLHCDSIYDARTLPLLGTGARWIWTLMFGHLGLGAPGAILDYTPLRELVEREYKPRRVDRAIRNGALHALCITASSYAEGKAVTFFHAHENMEEWSRARRSGVRARIEPKHMLASSALPFIFEPVELNGHYYGDGALRLTAPLSPAIRAGADRVMVIAARDNLSEPAADGPDRPPSIGEMAGHALDILFNDNLDSDVERMTRINHTLSLIPEDARAETPLRRIEMTMLSPSRDLRHIAGEHESEMPAALRMLMRTLGTWGSDGRLVSYLLFEPGYVGTLIDLGYSDTIARADEIRAFLDDS
ncbi:patatin-like phospholipase family protein [Roseovarius spongiae]|uniref:Patatin-like phospholipase family protein n=1 Tax=Roseovarius spongiae TaxID=2320272 RepID=A0A3A8B879_9RHOB|nr:patatin-like phospholipase family protein [Roseovarius spongiae]RKF13596.1 patatin-like phospholipase family protein [Roseovarius spongiae]